ncbi:MAG: hypothetical protein IPL46_00895 [Saprospiraceae bacterium]|nr:hypothetical protein [Saprospiraceae bacterium]
MSIKTIKIFGERNSGTNYLAELLKSNLEVDLLTGTVPNFEPFIRVEWVKEIFYLFSARHNLGWKHAEINLSLVQLYRSLAQLHFVTITKNPYSFLLSLFDNPHQIVGKRPAKFRDFLSNAWITRKREYTQSHFESPILLWNAKNASYLRLLKEFPDRCKLLTYENLIVDPESYIIAIADQFDLHRIGPFRNIEKSTKNNGKAFSDYRTYYLSQHWQSRLRREDLEIINEKLDHNLMHYFGYSILENL